MSVNDNTELKGNILKQAPLPVSQEKLLQPNAAGGAIKAGNSAFKDEFDKLLNSNFSFDPSAVISGLIPVDYLQPMGIMEEFETISISTKEIENSDAMFFLNAANQGENLNFTLKDSINVIDAANYKTMEVSKTLGNLLMQSAENNKSLRLDFDNNVTVILKVAADGKIDASFIPQNREVENYLKNNIDYLKQRFDEQTIAYSNISYKPYKQPKDERQGQNNERQGKNNE